MEEAAGFRHTTTLAHYSEIQFNNISSRGDDISKSRTELTERDMNLIRALYELRVLSAKQIKVSR